MLPIDSPVSLAGWVALEYGVRTTARGRTRRCTTSSSGLTPSCTKRRRPSSDWARRRAHDPQSEKPGLPSRQRAPCRAQRPLQLERDTPHRRGKSEQVLATVVRGRGSSLILNMPSGFLPTGKSKMRSPWGRPQSVKPLAHAGRRMYRLTARPDRVGAQREVTR